MMTKINIKAGGFLLVLLTGMASPACADVYAWVDGNGKMTYSDATPPKGARVLNVVRDAPLPAGAALKAAQDAQIRLLSQRIALLELEIERSARTPPPTVAYSAPPPAPACDPNWSGCGAPLYVAPLYVAPLTMAGRGHGEQRFEHRRAQQFGGQLRFGGRPQPRSR